MVLLEQKIKLLLSNEKVRDMDALRLVMLYALRYENHTNNDIIGLVNALRRRRVDDKMIKASHAESAMTMSMMIVVTMVMMIVVMMVTTKTTLTTNGHARVSLYFVGSKVVRLQVLNYANYKLRNEYSLSDGICCP